MFFDVTRGDKEPMKSLVFVIIFETIECGPRSSSTLRYVPSEYTVYSRQTHRNELLAQPAALLVGKEKKYIKKIKVRGLTE